MKRLTEAVNAYREENPEAGEAEIIKAFGTPEDCAAELLAECDPARVAAVRRRKKLLLWGVIAALLLLALALVGLLAGRGAGGAAPEAEGILPLPGHSHGHSAGHH